jgi:hypothetical protein
MKDLIIIRYTFEPYFSGYYEDGNWYNEDGKKINKRSYNGCICVQDGQRRYGMKKLKTFAKKIEITKNKLPF